MKKQNKDLATLNSSFLSLDALFLPPPTHIRRNPPNIISLSCFLRSRAVIAPKSININSKCA